VISYEDLDLSLQHVTICCPNTRCVLRCRQQVVGELLRRLDTDGSRDVSFDEFRNYFSLLPQVRVGARMRARSLSLSRARMCVCVCVCVSDREG
jgi:hypothetical protein